MRVSAKKMAAAACAGLFCVLGSGCSSVVMAQKFNGMAPVLEDVRPVAHVNSQISGLYFLGFLPVFSGTVMSSNTTSIFTDTATIDNAFFQMNIAAKNAGANAVLNVTTMTDKSMVVPFLFTWNRATSCGTAVQYK